MDMLKQDAKAIICVFILVLNQNLSLIGIVQLERFLILLVEFVIFPILLHARHKEIIHFIFLLWKLII